MRHIWTIAVKELRSYFNSAVALIFLATFLAVVLYVFFFVDRFFGRNIADVRPLFEWLPLLLIFLVSALTMRQWSEEQKTGTLEILLTLPVPIHRLVLGKFLAGLMLVAIALGLTLGLPLTVAQMGELDWGPVIGGYLAALLLASAYLAIGLCISSITENMIVSLISTVVVLGLLFLPGTDVVTGLVGIETGEFLRKLGMGSRFESIARGVLDLRDLAYYASVVAMFLTLNTVLLKAKGWSKGERMRPVRVNSAVAVLLVALNALVLNIWLTPVHSARVDLTRGGFYSLSEPTEELLDAIDETLTIRGYFSDKIHGAVDPLVPQIQDILAEYKIEGRGKVVLSFEDPTKNEELEKELNERYDIQSVPVRSFTRHEDSVINAYFHVLISYGDQHEVLSFEHLTRVESDGEGQPVVLLGNVEYEVTKAIRKVVYGFQSLGVVFSAIPGDVVLEAYVSREALPPNLKTIADTLDTVAGELVAELGDKFKYRPVSPSTDEERQNLKRTYGIEPMSMWNAGKVTPIYFHVLVRVGERMVPVAIPYDDTKATPAAVREAVTRSVRRMAPGFVRVIGMVTPKGAAPGGDMALHMEMADIPSPQNFGALKQMLGSLYEVRDIDLDNQVPDDVNVLIVAGPEKLVPLQQIAVDQFLMRGGSLIVLAGQYRPRPPFWTNPSLEVITSGLDELLAHWGVKVGDRLVADPSSDESFMKVGMRIHQLRYPFFVKVPGASMGQGGLITSGLDSVTLHLGTALTLTEAKGADDVARPEQKVLMTSSKDAWLHEGREVTPDLFKYPGVGFARPDVQAEGQNGPHILAVAMTGTFTSMFADKEKVNEKNSDPAAIQLIGRLLKRSPPDARLVVVGSSSFASDEMLGLSAQVGSTAPDDNLEFMQNLVDWAVEDTDLLSIRASNTASNLKVEVDEQTKWEFMNYGIAFFGLILVIGLSRVLPKPTINLALARKQSVRKDRKAGGAGQEPAAGAKEAKSNKEDAA